MRWLHSAAAPPPLTHCFVRYSYSSKLGLSKQQLQEEKDSQRVQRLQRLGRLSAAIENERRETKDLVAGIEDVTNALGMEHKVTDRGVCFAHALTAMQRRSHATCWLAGPATATLCRGCVIQVSKRGGRRAAFDGRRFKPCRQLELHANASIAEGKGTLDDLQDASENIAHAELRRDCGGGKRLEQVVSHWAGAPPKEDKFK